MLTLAFLCTAVSFFLAGTALERRHRHEIDRARDAAFRSGREAGRREARQQPIFHPDDMDALRSGLRVVRGAGGAR